MADDTKDLNNKTTPSIPGTVRTMKDDLSSSPSPEDRLNQINTTESKDLESLPASKGESIKVSTTVKPVPELKKSVISSTNNNSKAINPTLGSSKSIQAGTLNSSSLANRETNNSLSTGSVPPSERPLEPSRSESLGGDLRQKLSTVAPNTSSLKSGFNIDLEESTPISQEPPHSNPSSVEAPSTPKKPTYTGFSEEDNLEDPMSLNASSGNSIAGSTSKSKSKLALIGIGVLIVLIGASFGGYALIQNQSETETSTSGNGDTTTDPTTTPPVVTGTPLTNPSSLPITITSATIRSDILNTLSGNTEKLVELKLSEQSGQVLAWEDISSAMGITLPSNISQEVVKGWVYGYNQNGIYKILAILELESDQSAASLVQMWAPTVPQDMAGFSLSSVSRGVSSTAVLSSVDSTTSSGETVTSYFYNYSDPTDSIDITTRDNYILIGTSQESMQYLKNTVDTN